MRGYENDVNLEKCMQPGDVEGIHLLEGSLAGKCTYFFSWYFFEKFYIANIIFPISGAMVGFLVHLMYLAMTVIFTDRPEPTFLEMVSPLWIISHYFLYFILFFANFINYRKTIRIEKKFVQKILEEVAGMNLVGDPMVWRRIAFSVNDFFERAGHHYAIFYSGEQCRRFFVREIVQPIESGSYEIKTYRDDGACTDYCADVSNKMLAQRAVANYNKSVEKFGELSDMDGKDECGGRLVEIYHNIMENIAPYSLLLEGALVLVIYLVLMVSLILTQVIQYFSVR